MTWDMIYFAVAGIDEEYLSDSENMTEIKAKFRRERIKRRSLLVSVCACFVLAVGVIGTVKITHSKPPAINSTTPLSLTKNTQITNVDSIAVIPFSANIDPDADAYGADSIHEVRLTVHGVTYEQLAEADYSLYGLSLSITGSMLGEAAGTVIESFPNRKPDGDVYSPEPSLVGADVYYYSPTGGKSVVIAIKDGRCSPFAVWSWGANQTFREVCAFFGAEPNDAGIERITYKIGITEEGVYRVAEEKTIAEPERINRLCEVLLQLAPEEPSENVLASTPQWFIDAMQAYKEDPERVSAEDIVITVYFRNGTMIRDILYKPYIGNGYFDKMKQLTPQQNARLRSMFE